MRYYTYDYNYLYTGYVDSDVSVSSSTTTAPTDDTHILYNPDTNNWLVPTTNKTLTDYINEELVNAKNYYDDFMVSSSEYTADFESSTYTTQENEWKAWVADPDNAYTPYVKILSDKRSLTIAELHISGDETANFMVGDSISGTISLATAIISSMVYNADTDTTTFNLRSVVGDFILDETFSSLTNTTTKVIIYYKYDISDLMDKIGFKVKYYATIQGELHAYQDIINTCTTIDEVLALDLPWRV